MSKQLTMAVYDTDYETGERTGDPIRIETLPVEGGMFIWDECHKIYLITSEADRQQMLECGWDRDDFRPLSELPDAWEASCPLRFISSGDLSKQYVEQGEDADVTYQ